MNLWALWGKTYSVNEGRATRPLLCHMVDVAEVVGAMWDTCLGEGLRRHIAEALGCDEEGARRTIMFWASLHDLGKASPAFQRRYEPAVPLLEKEGLKFPQILKAESSHHGAITVWAVTKLLRALGLSVEWASGVAKAVGGHHGTWPSNLEVENFAAPSHRGGNEWQSLREQLSAQMADLIMPPCINPSDQPFELRNAILTLLSGLTSVSDWIASIEDLFTTSPAPQNLCEYTILSAEHARAILMDLGFGGWSAPDEAISIGKLCGLTELWPLQECIVGIASELSQPGLVIIEAPTGVGKTEAALHLADHWARVLRQNGMYIAMPTMATSNQMYSRVKKVLANRYPNLDINYQLLHGDALLMQADRLPGLGAIAEDANNGQLGRIRAAEWFSKRKRGLLAPFAVGTVDQALLAILQTNHFFIRLLGLSHKTVVFDEVHAYDTYMERLFFLLLRWLGILRSSVVILSATLPENTRQRIVEAYLGKAVTLPVTPYPSVTWSQSGGIKRIHIVHKENRSIELRKINRDPETIISCLREDLADGGCAAVICNTVRRAQDLFKAVREAQIVPADRIILFHARFPREKRVQIEKLVTDRFGKGARRSPQERFIVIATQVIEQSLDLDFDMMVSDLAPIDLIIQRVGRLHRHPDRTQRGERPRRLDSPHLYLAMPESEGDRVLFDRSDTFIYARYVLLRSYLVLKDLSRLDLPQETERLIEDVYGSEERLGVLPEAVLNDLAAARKEMERDMNHAESEALKRLIGEPDRGDLLDGSNAGLEEDDPQLSNFRRAATRLAPPSVTLICLRGSPENPWITKDGQVVAVNLHQEPRHEEIILLANQQIESSDYRLVQHFLAKEPPVGWKNTAFLRYARPAFFDDMGQYLAEGEDWILVLDDDLGLMITEKEGI